MAKHPYEAWLDKISNPSQYLGREFNSVVKKREDVDCRIALCFPELYTIAMSNLGLKILYSELNDTKNIWAERFFAPEPDMEKAIKDNSETLRSLESRDPLNYFDIVGFSISTELCYTEILAMLELGSVPIYQKKRNQTHPLVIGGGPSVYNPEPIADFFDLFILGEAEEVLIELCLMVADLNDKGLSREELLLKLASLKGVYVPSLFNVAYSGNKVKSVKPINDTLPTPQKVYIDDLNKKTYPYDMVIPFGQPVFDRLSVEIDRGCTEGCRFCQAGITYRPVRERDPDKVLEVVKKGLTTTGFDALSLVSLSSGDYGNISELVKMLMDKASDESVALSLPSIRSGTLTQELIDEISRVRQTGFTITAEAGSERLRQTLNKKITDKEIIETASKVLEAGWRNLKVYFMIGLPQETDDDIESIVTLVKRIDALKINGNRFRKINVGVSQFVPKSFSAFQWVKMDSVETMLGKKIKLLKAFKPMRAVSVKGHDVEMSFMEGAFSRGDRRLSSVIEKAYRYGNRLDGWSDYFNYQAWLKAFEESGLDPQEIAGREREPDETLPWDHFDIGVSKKYLLREYELSKKGEESNDCRTGSCLACGLNHKNKKIVELIKYESKPKQIKNVKPAEFFRYRITFKKIKLARYLSHLELKTAFLRAIKRAELPPAYSQGFHPHIKASFGDAVSVGVSSYCEIIDLDLNKKMDEGKFKTALNDKLEEGIEIIKVNAIFPPYKSIPAITEKTLFGLVISATPENESLVKKLDEVFDSIDTIEYEKRTALDKTVYRIQSATPGILSKIRKGGLAEFTLSPDVQLTKTGLVLSRP